MLARWPALLLLAAAAAMAQTVDDFLDGSVLQEIRITMRASDWQNLVDHFQDNTYYSGRFTWRGMTVDNVAIRSKGRVSRRATKPGLRIDMNRYEEQTFLTLKAFSLKNNISDPSELKERISMQIFRRMGLHAPKQAHAKVYVNNEYLGVYTLMEETDNRLMTEWFNDSDGFLYEWQFVQDYRMQYLGPDPAQYSPVPFEPKTNENKPDPKPLEAMIRTINQSSDADFVRATSEFLDLRKFLTHIAVESFLAEMDGFLSDQGMNNLYFFRYKKGNLGQWIPKDKDNAFHTIDFPGLNNIKDNVLTRRSMDVPELKQYFVDEIARTAAVIEGPGGWMDQEIDREYALIRDAVRLDNKKECPAGPCSLEDSNFYFEVAVQDLKRYSSERMPEMLRQLSAAGYPLPGTAATPKIVPGGAVNAATNAAGAVAPGSLVALYGQNLATGVSQASVPWPTLLGASQVEVNGRAAPLYFVSPGQVNFQLPWEAAAGTASVQAVASGQRSETITIQVAPTSPGVFAIVNAAGIPPTGGNAAAAGDYLIVYANGLGSVSNRPESGAGAPSDPLARTLETPAVTVGGVDAPVAFSGLAPGFVGLYQINIQVPGGVGAAGSVPVIIRAGGQASPGVPIAVR